MTNEHISPLTPKEAVVSLALSHGNRIDMTLLSLPELKVSNNVISPSNRQTPNFHQ